jgi:hypothetical protein
MGVHILPQHKSIDYSTLGKESKLSSGLVTPVELRILRNPTLEKQYDQQTITPAVSSQKQINANYFKKNRN